MNQTHIPTTLAVTRIQMPTILLRPHNLVELECQTSVPHRVNDIFCVEGLFAPVEMDKASTCKTENGGKMEDKDLRCKILRIAPSSFERRIIL